MSYMRTNSYLGIGTELLQKITPLGPIHKASVVGVAPDGEELVLDHPKGGASHFIPVKDFAAGTETFVGKRGPSSLAEQQAIQNRAVQAVGTRYNVFARNCEHVSSFVRTGKAESPQLAIFVVLAIFLGAVFIASK
jgi:hypothetical protein